MTPFISLALAALTVATLLWHKPAAAQPFYGQGVPLYEQDGTYRGNFNGNPYGANSMSNPYGRYGSPYSSDSLSNPYGAGNPYRVR